MTVYREKKHFFVGMDIEIKDNGVIKMTMDIYLYENIEEAIIRTRPTHVGGGLFKGLLESLV